MKGRLKWSFQIEAYVSKAEVMESLSTRWSITLTHYKKNNYRQSRVAAILDRDPNMLYLNFLYKKRQRNHIEKYNTYLDVWKIEETMICCW